LVDQDLIWIPGTDGVTLFAGDMSAYDCVGTSFEESMDDKVVLLVVSVDCAGWGGTFTSSRSKTAFGPESI
jgi:hypothetical protein